ncbi:unnamed protein product, partial [Adineta ricciae]
FISPVTIQPNDPNLFLNTFSTLNGENVIRSYQCSEGCSPICGPKSSVVFTDKRIIARHQEPDGCGCCSNISHVDTVIFMRDIEVMKETDQSTGTRLAALIMVLTCTWPILLCKVCCGDHPKVLEIKGAFGSEFIKFKREEFKHAADELSSIVLPMKN